MAPREVERRGKGLGERGKPPTYRESGLGSLALRAVTSSSSDERERALTSHEEQHSRECKKEGEDLIAGERTYQECLLAHPLMRKAESSVSDHVEMEVLAR